MCSAYLASPKTVKVNLVDTLDAVDAQDLSSKVFDHYNDVLGCISDIFHISTNPSCQHVILPPLHVPIKLQPKI